MELDKVEVIVDDKNGVGNKFTWICDDLIFESILFNIETWSDVSFEATIQQAIKMFQDYYRQKYKSV